jgi:ketosteroid isomerase-like protein
MTTRETVQKYYDGVARKDGWQSVISDDMEFVSPGSVTQGKDAYVSATARFLSMVQGSEVKQLIIEGDRACALVDYEVVTPTGNTGNCSVAEILSAKDGKIDSSTIFFDTAAFKALMSSPKMQDQVQSTVSASSS